jgi:hypothetical protein
VARTSTLAALSIILIGFGVPAICVYSSVSYGFNYIVSGLISLFALIIAGILAVVGIAIGSEEIHLDSFRPSEKEKINLLRAHQRATLEEMDEINSILKDIRDLLKAAQE